MHPSGQRSSAKALASAQEFTRTHVRVPEFGHARKLWASLPSGLAEAFRPRAGIVAREMIEAIQEAVPPYSQPLRGQFGVILTQGCEQAIHQCIDSLRDSGTPQEHWKALYRHIGRVEFHEGRSLDHLQTSYRVGGRVATRHIAEFVKTNKLDEDLFCTAAEAVMAYIDEISMLSLEGYTAAKARSAGALARKRRRLFELLLSDPPAAPETIMSLADRAAWPVPDRVTMVALRPRADQHEMDLPEFGDEVLADCEGAKPCLLVPGSVGDADELADALDGWRAVVGVEVPLTSARVSLYWARRTMKLIERGVLPDVPLTHCADHLTVLWLLTDEFLMRQLSKRSLAPLDSLTPKQRRRLGTTLLALLQSGGSAPEISEMLDVHPQTVRYRMRQLRDLFGDRLHDPRERFELEIALRVRNLVGT